MQSEGKHRESIVIQHFSPSSNEGYVASNIYYDLMVSSFLNLF